MIILLKLILAHLIGDFLLQPKTWVTEKESKKLRSLKLYLHMLIHGLLVLVLLWDLHYWLLALMIMLVHGVIDVIKLYQQNDRNQTSWFIADQLLHLGSIVGLYLLLFQPQWHIRSITANPAFWIYTTAIVFITVVAGIIIQVLLKKWSDELPDLHDKAPKIGHHETLKSAGRYIGILERLLTFLFILIGQWGAIGFLLAAKSVFRFGDLKEAKDKKLTEYILIGTLLSFGMAIATGILVKYLVNITNQNAVIGGT